MRDVERPAFKQIVRRFLGEYDTGQRIRTCRLRRAINTVCPGGGGNILDAGCGEGEHAIYFASKFPYSNVVGVDLNVGCIQRCHHKLKKSMRGNVTFIQGDLVKTLRNLNREFALIYCIDVLEHIQDDSQMLESFYRLLAPGGRLIIHVPNMSQRHLSEWSNFQRPEYTDHIRDGYEPEVIRDKLLELGFVISEMRLTFRDLGIVAADICEIFDGRTSIGVLSIRLIAHPILALFALLDGIIVRRTGNGIFIDALKIAQHKCDFPSQRSTASSGGQSES